MLNSIHIVIFAVTFSLQILLHNSVNGLEDPPPAPERPCKSITADFTKRQLTGITVCGKTLKFKNGKEKSKSLNCILVCAMKREGLIDEEGQITHEKVNYILKREFPASLLKKANSTFFPCAELALKNKLESNRETDPYCTSYDPPIKCLLSSLPKLCT